MSPNGLEIRCGTCRAALASNGLECTPFMGEPPKISVRFDDLIQNFIVYAPLQHNSQLFQFSLKKGTVIPYNLQDFILASVVIRIKLGSYCSSDIYS